jgi:hypothetical protein
MGSLMIKISPRQQVPGLWLNKRLTLPEALAQKNLSSEKMPASVLAQSALPV